MKLRLLLAATSLALAISGHAADPVVRIITCGWNAPTAGQFARDLDTMPGSLPLSGCVMTLHADSGDPDPLATAHGTADWSGLDVARSINAVAAASKERMPDNYLLLKANPGDVDWTNDEGWSTIVDHYRIAARLARQAGLRGLLLDFEPYTEPHRQFQYSRQPAAIDHSFADYQSAARRRGRQVMDAIATEFPNAELCTFFLLSYLIEDHHHRGPSPIGRGDAQWCLAGHAYGLLPAFVDGWLDVIPPEITIIDGCENGYWFTSEEQFKNCAQGVRHRSAQLVSAENRDKYSKQIRVAFPIYLDAIHPKLADPYTLEPERSDRLSLFRRNLAAALRSSDAMVWLYGEHGRWWPEAGDQALWNGKDVYPVWEEHLPGISQLLIDVVADHVTGDAPDRDAIPAEHSADSQSVAIAKQPDDAAGQIEATVVDLQPVWDVQRGHPSGDVVLGDGQVTMTAARDVAGTATFATEADRRYMVQVQVIQEGRGMTKLSLRLQTPKGQWWPHKRFDVVAYPPDGDPFQPRTITAIVQTPPEPHRLVVICSASNQLTKDDAALFGNLVLGLVDP